MNTRAAGGKQLSLAKPAFNQHLGSQMKPETCICGAYSLLELTLRPANLMETLYENILLSRFMLAGPVYAERTDVLLKQELAQLPCLLECVLETLCH